MPSFILCTAVLLTCLSAGCSHSVSGKAVREADRPSPAASRVISFKADSPAETVRVFYRYLREKKFREAIFLTNLRPAIEGLTDTELKDFQVDFEAMAQNVPAEIELNGEIVSGDKATVTAKLPGDAPGRFLTQQIDLRRENGVWVILTVDELAEQRIKKEGKNYFYMLRMETHEDEARDMLQRISKAQIAHLALNGSLAEIPKLIEAQLLPADASSSASTGYDYVVRVIDGGKRYFATATPAQYGRSGRLSFAFESDARHIPKIVSKDSGGQPLQK